ncbi:MAG TPA: xylulokinase [Ktedonobacterales bacterium]|nr:xylulokinase [Ktedonobacterales bacterium]
MPTPSLFLGIDLSTTGAKAVLIDGGGGVIASATTAISLSTPRPLWSEQDPLEWWAATVRSVRRALAEADVAGTAVAAVGLTGQMHGLVALGEYGGVLRPAILWNDQRTGAECDEIRACVGRERLIQITGNDALPGFTAPKILWMRNHEPEIYERIRHILLPKDYIRFRLTGAYALDKADGSGTLLFDLKRRNWSEDVTAALEIPLGWLPPTFEGTETTGTVSAEAAAETGLASGTAVVAGGGDQSAQAVGVGAVEPGVLALTLGTSGVVFGTTITPEIEPQGRLHAFCHAVPGRWHLMGVMLSAAGSLQWYRDTLAPDVPFNVLLDEAATAPAGCDGLLFLPYLSGERTPYADPLARGAFVGLTLRHHRAHLTRAVLEGVAFGLRDCYDLMRQAGMGDVREVRVSGGGARSALWTGILASVLETPLVRVSATEGAAYGAALLAGVGAGNWPDVPAACAGIHIAGQSEPNVDDRDVYRRLHPVYQALYPALKSSFAQLSG